MDPRCCCCWLLFLLLLVSGGSHCSERKKRYLIFPEGSQFQVVYCLTLASDSRRTGDLVVGLTAALVYSLPEKVEPNLVHDLHRSTRAALYPKIEAFLSSTGLDGRSCVMRALCEAGQRRLRRRGDRYQEEPGTFLQELLHAVFTLRNDDGSVFEDEESRRYDHAAASSCNREQQEEEEVEVDCRELYPRCRHSIYELDF